MNRHLETDVLVIGSGIAGLTTALKASAFADVLVVTKKDRVDSSTNWAQGGVAAVTGADDSVDLHVADTLIAGAGLCHRRTVEDLAREGPERVRELIDWGVRFSRSEAGDLALGREAGHSRRRILHAADLTGREIERALVAAVAESERIRILDDHFAWRLHTSHGRASGQPRCTGALIFDVHENEWLDIAAGAVVLATGGCGRLYRHTTNPSIATGDGVALGYEVGAAAANLEFIQFHPTALWPAAARAFLISEAVRGEGAILRDVGGEDLMQGVHRAGSLAPRDVVARAIHAEMRRTGAEHAWLDTTMIPEDRFRDRFPTIYEACREAGVRVPEEPIPVVPAAHYQCGGLLADWDGRTSLPGLLAVGEVACSGVHGANRLASNSLLEAVVFAHRAARRLRVALGGIGARARSAIPRRTDPAFVVDDGVWGSPKGLEPEQVETTVQDTMWELVGLVRSDGGLEEASARLDDLSATGVRGTPDPLGAMRAREAEFQVRVARLIVRCARRRLESRGLHFTESHPGRDNERFLRDTVIGR